MENKRKRQAIEGPEKEVLDWKAQMKMSRDCGRMESGAGCFEKTMARCLMHTSKSKMDRTLRRALKLKLEGKEAQIARLTGSVLRLWSHLIIGKSFV